MAICVPHPSKLSVSQPFQTLNSLSCRIASVRPSVRYSFGMTERIRPLLVAVASNHTTIDAREEATTTYSVVGSSQPVSSSCLQSVRRNNSESPLTGHVSNTTSFVGECSLKAYIVKTVGACAQISGNSDVLSRSPMPNSMSIWETLNLSIDALTQTDNSLFDSGQSKTFTDVAEKRGLVIIDLPDPLRPQFPFRGGFRPGRDDLTARKTASAINNAVLHGLSSTSDFNEADPAFLASILSHMVEHLDSSYDSPLPPLFYDAPEAEKVSLLDMTPGPSLSRSPDDIVQSVLELFKKVKMRRRQILKKRLRDLIKERRNGIRGELNIMLTFNFTNEAKRTLGRDFSKVQPMTLRPVPEHPQRFRASSNFITPLSHNAVRKTQACLRGKVGHTIACAGRSFKACYVHGYNVGCSQTSHNVLIPTTQISTTTVHDPILDGTSTDVDLNHETQSHGCSSSLDASQPHGLDDIQPAGGDTPMAGTTGRSYQAGDSYSSALQSHIIATQASTTTVHDPVLNGTSTDVGLNHETRGHGCSSSLDSSQPHGLDETQPAGGNTPMAGIVGRSYQAGDSHPSALGSHTIATQTSTTTVHDPVLNGASTDVGLNHGTRSYGCSSSLDSSQPHGLDDTQPAGGNTPMAGIVGRSYQAGDSHPSALGSHTIATLTSTTTAHDPVLNGASTDVGMNHETQSHGCSSSLDASQPHGLDDTQPAGGDSPMAGTTGRSYQAGDSHSSALQSHIIATLASTTTVHDPVLNGTSTDVGLNHETRSHGCSSSLDSSQPHGLDDVQPAGGNTPMAGIIGRSYQAGDSHSSALQSRIIATQTSTTTVHDPVLNGTLTDVGLNHETRSHGCLSSLEAPQPHGLDDAQPSSFAPSLFSKDSSGIDEVVLVITLQIALALIARDIDSLSPYKKILFYSVVGFINIGFLSVSLGRLLVKSHNWRNARNIMFIIGYVAAILAFVAVIGIVLPDKLALWITSFSWLICLAAFALAFSQRRNF